MVVDLPPIPARVERLEPEVLSRLARTLLSDGNHPAGAALAWAEKLRRFVEVNRPNLGAVVRQRFGRSNAAAMLGMIADVLCSAALRRGPEELPDLVFFNAALRVLDLSAARPGIGSRKAQAPDPSAPGRYAAAVAGALVADLADATRWGESRRAAIVAAPGLGEIVTPPKPYTERRTPFRVVVLCPQPRSLYTLLVLSLMEQADVQVAGILIRTMTADRFVQEFRRDGFRLLHKVWRKLVLQSDENRDTSDQSLSDMAREQGLSRETVPRFAAKRNIPCLQVTRFDTRSALEFLNAARPNYVVFTGGGVIAPETIKASGEGIINCHMGVLPQYKGMDVVEWPLLEGIYEQIGATTHLMARGIDTGPLLSGFTVDPRNYGSLGSLRNGIMGRMPVVMRNTVIGLRDGTIAPQPQSPGGRQYFMLHPTLQTALPLVFRSFAEGNHPSRMA